MCYNCNRAIVDGGQHRPSLAGLLLNVQQKATSHGSEYLALVVFFERKAYLNSN